MKKKSKKLSGGLAILGQALVLLFFTPFCLFLLYIILTKNFTLEGVAFILIIFVLSILVVAHAYSYADLYLEEDSIKIKKLFYVNSKPITDYKTIEQAIMPLKYCILFQDGSKACFVLSTTSIFRHVISTDPNRVLNELRLEFQKLKQEHSSKV